MLDVFTHFISFFGNRASLNMYSVNLKSITKRFGNKAANDRISFEVKQGSVHAILGENGAGKTTLMNILAGILQPDHGTIEIYGRELSISNPRIAKQNGIGMVHQHCSLIPALSILENAILDLSESNTPPTKKVLKKRLKKMGRDFSLNLDPQMGVWELSHSQRQWVQIVIKLVSGASILILDEPTSSLGPIEGDRLLEKIKALSKAGKTVLLVTHKLREIEKFADFVTVLRKGRHVVTKSIDEVNIQELPGLMVGQGVEVSLNKVLSKDDVISLNSKKSVLDVKNLVIENSFGNTIIGPVSFVLNGFEILGVAGIAGSGQEELAECIFGMWNNYRGSIEYKKNNALAEELNIRYIPADRIGTGAVGALPVLYNLVLREFYRPPFSRGFLIRERYISEEARRRVERFQIQLTSLSMPIRHLSGGNIQRVVLARELSGKFDVLIAHNPSSGLDVQGASFVREKLAETKNRGCGILLISEDLDELMALSDRLLVLHNGDCFGPYPVSVLTKEQIGAMMLGEEVDIGV